MQPTTSTPRPDPMGQASFPRLIPAPLRQPVGWTLLIVLALVAGCVSPSGAGDGHGEHGEHGDEATPGILDTGDLAPGAEATLTFNELGTFTIHCHPHPWMVQNVTVTDADAPPSAVHVHILDGDTPEEYGFEPRSLSVGQGSTVTYHNHGRLAHTATRQ